MPSKSLPVTAYTVGWLCALEEEELAAWGMLDERHDNPKPCPLSQNAYTYGEIYGHNVVIVRLPTNQTGQAGAARTAVLFSESFPTMKIYLFVGIGGGMPFNPYDKDKRSDIPRPIHLGDVVVASPVYSGVPAVVEFGRGRHTQDGFESFGIMGNPITPLVIAVDRVAMMWKAGGPSFYRHLKRLSPEALRERGVNDDLDKFERPDSKYDVLFKPEYEHVSSDGRGNACLECCHDHALPRSPRSQPTFHRGPIASGNVVIQKATVRDKLSKEFGNVICFEMEAAGVMLETQCLVIRGISDYADSHKNYWWHDYAAATAAAFARQLLLDMPPRTLEQVAAKRLSVQPPTRQASTSLPESQRTPAFAEVPDNSDARRHQQELTATPTLQQRDNASTNSTSTTRPFAPVSSYSRESGGNLRRTHRNDPKIPGQERV